MDDAEYDESYSICSWDGEEEFHVNNISKGNNDGIRIKSMRPTDKGYHSFIRKISKAQQKKIGVYETPDIPNAKIKNAVTGILYLKEMPDGLRHTYYFLGSKEQDLFFKVKMLNGDTMTPLVLFYSSPEEYEKHQFVVLSDSIKDNWRKKVSAYRESCD
jgi:hypothetical protein